MSLLKLRFINWHRLLSTPEKLFIKREISIYKVKQCEDLLINKVLDEKEEFNIDKWLIIRDDLCKNHLEVNEANVDCVIVDRCWEAEKYELALNYIQYLIRTVKKKLNVGSIGRYFKLLFDLKRPLDPQEIEEIYQLYDQVMNEYPIVDSLTAENFIFGLSLTERWKECLKLLDMVETSSRSRVTTYSTIISAAFEHDDFSTGWQYLEGMYPRLSANFRAYNSFLNYCKRVSNNERELDYVVSKLFQLWKNFDVTPSLETVMLFVDTLTSTGGWTARKIKVEKNGYCGSCQQTLKPLKIEEKEFEYLSNAVLSDTLIGADVYRKTTPRELQRFKNFVNSTKPYDICVDGLNVAYTLNRTKKTSTLGKELATVIAELLKQHKKIFVLGRQHMTKWSSKDMEFIRNNCYLFFAHNLSHDDPFLLYASLASGINTYFVSRDLMRQHKFLLEGNKIQQIFRHWQMCRQIFPMYVGTNFHRTLLFVQPPKYLPIAQKDSNGWHLPYTENLSTQYLNIAEPTKTWICLRKKS